MKFQKVSFTAQKPFFRCYFFKRQKAVNIKY